MAISDNAAIGLGATVEINDGSGGAGSAFGEVVDVVDMDVPDVEVGMVERKTLNLSDRTLRKKAALKDPGEFSFVYEYSMGKKARLDALIGTDKSFKVTLPDAGDGAYTKTWPGFIKSNKLNRVSPDGLMTATCVVTVTGPATA